MFVCILPHLWKEVQCTAAASHLKEVCFCAEKLCVVEKVPRGTRVILSHHELCTHHHVDKGQNDAVQFMHLAKLYSA